MPLRKRLPSLVAVFSIGVLAFLAAPFVQAQADPIKTEIAIPLPQPVEGYTGNTVTDLANYIDVIYQFVISIIGLVAAIMMIIGGFQYLTSAGEDGKIGAAKKRITNALMGLVLAFSAYLLLNTINPELLRFKPIGNSLANVQTELALLPWCDEVIAKGTKVNPIYGLPGNCGSVGEFMQDKSRVACLYRSACPDERFSDIPSSVNPGNGNMHSTCVQTTANGLYASDPLSSQQVLRFADDQAKLPIWKQQHPNALIPETGSAEKNAAYNRWFEETIASLPDVYTEPMTPRSSSLLQYPVNFFATCRSCLSFGAVQKTGTSNKQPSKALCDYWQQQANFTAQLQGHLPSSMCTFIEGGCAQADFRCESPSSSCGKYNSVKPLLQFDLAQGGFVWWTYGDDKIGTVSARPDALQELCLTNPCGYNSGGGCTGKSGIVNDIRSTAAVVRDGIYGIQSCINK